MTTHRIADHDENEDWIDLDDIDSAAGRGQWMVAATAATPVAGQRRGLHTPRPSRRDGYSSRRTAVAAAVAVTAVLVVSLWALIGNRPSRPAVSATPTTSVVFDERSPIVAGTALNCPAEASAGVAAVTGLPALQANSGAAAIVAFELAYYQARDGRAARQWIAAGAAVSDAAGIQAGIDSQPPAAFCARIQRLLPGLYDVQLREHRPGEPEIVWQQRITTSTSDGRVVITAITGT
ncbi:hypothetical protein GZH49_12100 [Nocardia terpenica]|uniref:hypothetical protein n=1 Tax=Nocardia terpenica TaxID=455432 RepID=UPI002FE20C5C